MPTLRDVTVHITDSSKVKLQEWGIQILRGHNKVSSYIKSETDMSFQIMIQPKIPYIASDAASAHDYKTRMRGTERPGFFKMEDEWEDIDNDYSSPGIHDRNRGGQLRSNTSECRHHRRSGSDRDSHRQPDQLQPKDEQKSLSSPIRPGHRRRIPPPAFHFLASLYLDGRDKPERKAIVYLDPDDVDYNQPDGKVQMKTRWVEGRDGRLKEHAWVFKDVGIETVFDKMLISGDHQVSRNVHKRDEDAIIAAMESTGLDADGDIRREEKSQVGQIVVEIQRVKLGEKWDDMNFRAKFKEDDIKDVNMEGANLDITHTAGFGRGKSLGPQPVRVVAYTLYKEEEGPYATFQFFYRSQENLEKFNFADFPRTSRVLRSRRRLDATMSSITPLSIARPLPSSKSRISTFEEKIKRKSSNKIMEPQYNFGDSYRDHKPKFKKEESLSPTKDKLRLLLSPDAMTGSNTKTSPGSRKDGSSATGSDTSSFRPGSDQSRHKLRSAGKENILGVAPQNLAATSPQAPESSIPGLLGSPDASQSSTTSTLDGTGAEATGPDTDPQPAYRVLTYSSDVDADDEHSDSDLETETGSNKENTDENFLAYIHEGNDDRLGLHLELGKIAIGEKRCRSPEDGDNEATIGNALGDKSSRVKEEADGIWLTRSRTLLLPQYLSLEEQRREMMQLQRSNEHQKPMAGLTEQVKGPAKRIKISDGEEQLAKNKRATARDRLDFENAVYLPDGVRDSLDWELALAEADSTKRSGNVSDL